MKPTEYIKITTCKIWVLTVVSLKTNFFWNVTPNNMALCMISGFC